MPEQYNIFTLSYRDVKEAIKDFIVKNHGVDVGSDALWRFDYTDPKNFVNVGSKKQKES